MVRSVEQSGSIAGNHHICWSSLCWDKVSDKSSWRKEDFVFAHSLRGQLVYHGRGSWSCPYSQDTERQRNEDAELAVSYATQDWSPWMVQSPFRMSLPGSLGLSGSTLIDTSTTVFPCWFWIPTSSQWRANVTEGQWEISGLICRTCHGTYIVWEAEPNKTNTSSVTLTSWSIRKMLMWLQKVFYMLNDWYMYY